MKEPSLIQAKHFLLTLKSGKNDNYRDWEFSVFSQWGQDGLIQFLIHNLGIENGFFVEFGVQNYEEASTRFLLQNNNWSGLVMDSSVEFIDYIKRQEFYWKADITAISAFISRENINQLLSENCPKLIDLLVIDIDGNDYWIWEAISDFSPKIVVCEFNSLFGSKMPLSIPYKEDFDRTKAHYSNLYFGASLKALELLGKTKGYELVFVNEHANDAFFIRSDLNNLKALDSEVAYLKSKFRESRNKMGNLTFLNKNQSLNEIKDLEILNVEKKTLCKFSEILEEL